MDNNLNEDEMVQYFLVCFWFLSYFYEYKQAFVVLKETHYSVPLFIKKGISSLLIT